MILKKAKQLILEGRVYDAIDLLEKNEAKYYDNKLDLLESFTLLFFANQRHNNFAKLPDIYQKIQQVYIELISEHGAVQAVLEQFDKLIEGKETKEELFNSVDSLSDVQKSKIPLLLFIKFRPSIFGSDYDVNVSIAEKLSYFFKELKGQFYYADIIQKIAWTYLYKTKNSLALKYVEQSLQLFQELDDKPGISSTIGTKGTIYGNIGNCKKAINYSLEYLQKAEELGTINSIYRACLAVAYHYAMSGDINESSKFNDRCAKLEEHPTFTDTVFPHIRMLVESRISWVKGDIDKALEMQLQKLEDIRKFLGKYYIAIVLSLLGDSYYQKGNLTKATTYYIESLEVRESYGAYSQVAENYLQIIIVNLEQNQQEKATEYYEQLKELKESVDEDAVNQIFSLSKALFLSSYIDKESKEKAKQILIDLIGQEITYYQTTERAYLYLCDILLEEIRTSNDLQLLEELREYTKRLAIIATINDSHLLLIELYFLQSKMFLLELKVEEALELLELAQEMACEKGLVRLEILLSNEHDMLLNQLDVWEDFTTYLHTLEERLEYTHIEILLNNMIRKWVNYTDVHYDSESPCFFLMSNNEGTVLYSDSYSSLPFDPEKISNIQRKIQHICDEKRANSKITRFRFQEYSCILKTVQNLNICYVFMGNSYLPLKKMSDFLSDLKSSKILSKIIAENEENNSMSLPARIKLSKLIDHCLLNSHQM
ncbi:MAG: tetratricopeptide repeat protein [Candidatus Heimdallarchaeota archaeon]|nr:tetratricopeptide repeat protein [Candidatus Heimdallarchaeota archaeon]